jgi:hypothetical protein
MGRPLNKKYFGNRNIGSASTTADNKIGGEGIASIALGAANNSSGFTAGATQISIATPTLPNGVRATASLVVGPAGALLTMAAGTSGTNVTTIGSLTGTAVATTATYTGVPQKSTNGSGTGATFIVVRTGGTSYGSNTVVTANGKGTGYASGNTVTISGAQLGGVDGTNDLTITLGGSVAAAGTITGITITEKGSGYTTVPAVTLSTGTQGTLTLTSVLTVDTGAVGSTTNQENTILMTARLAGGSAVVVDIIKQTNDRRYKVTDGTRTGIVQLKSSVATAAGEGSVRLVDTDGGTYFATKLTAHKATITRGTGTQAAFTNGKQVKWNMTAATADSLLIDNA